MTEIASLGLKVEGVNNVDKASGSLDRFSKSGDRADKSAGRLAKGASGATAGVRATGVASKAASRDLVTLSGAAGTANKALSALGITVGVAGLVLGLSRATNQVGNFEAAINGLAAVSNATADQMSALEAQARSLGATSRFSAQQAAEGQRFLAQAGFDVNEILSATPGILKLATAGELDLARAADIASNVLGGMRLEVDQLNRVNDVLAATASRSNTTIEQLGQALSFAAPFAASASISIEEAAAAVGVMSDAGIQASRAGTGLVGVIRQLSNVTSSGEEVLRKYGIAVADVSIESRGLGPVLDTLRAAGLDTADAIALFGSEAGAAAQVLVQDFKGGIEGATGETERMAKILERGLNPAFLSLASAASESVLQLGDTGLAGGLESLIRNATGVISVWNGMGDAWAESNDISKEHLATIEAVAGAIGLASKIVAAGAAGYVAYRGAIVLASVSTKAYSAVLAAFSTQAALTTASVMTLAGAMKVLASAGVAFIAGWQVGSYLREEFEAIEKIGIAIAGGLHRTFIMVGGVMEQLGAEMQYALSRPLDYARTAITDFLLWLSGLGDKALGLLGLEGMMDGVTDKINGWKPETEAAFKETLETISKETKQKIGEVDSIYADMFARVGAGSGELSGAEKEVIKLADAVKSLTESLTGAGDGSTSKELELIAKAINDIQRAADPAFAALQDYQTGMDTLAEGLLNNIIDDQQFVTLADHLLQVRDAALEAAKGMSWLDNMEGGMDALQSGFQKIHSTMDSGSKEAQKLGQAMQALSVVQGIAAILNQGMGDPYTAIGRMAAMAAAVASLIGSVGFSGQGDTTAADAQATQGTGGVLGDASAQSESISKGVEITADATSALVGINRAQLVALEAMRDAISGASTQILRGGTDFTSSSSESNLIGAFGGGSLGSGFESLMSILDPVTYFADKLLGGSRAVINSGIEIAGGRINDLIDNTMVSAFQMVEEKKHFLDDKDTRRLSEALGDEVGGQFALVFGSMVDAVSASAEVLGFTEDQIRNSIAQFRVAATEISLMDLDGDEQQAAISAVFSDIFDSLAVSVVDYVPEFQQAGESYAETLVRIATQTQVAQEAMSQLGSVLLDGLGGQDIVQMSDDLIKAAGGLESFITGFTGFVDKFATDEHKLSVATTAINSAMSQLGLEVPQSEEALWDLMQTLTDPSQLAGLLRLQDSFATMFDMMDSVARERQGLTIQLLRLQGDAEGALAIERANALEGMHESNRALQEQIWALQDLEAAADKAAQSAQELADFQRGIADQLLGILSPAHAELNQLNMAMGAQIAQAQELGIAEEDLANMRRLHQLQLLEFAAGLEESIASLSDELFGEADSGMNRTVNAVGSGMNKVRDLIISGIAQVNDWLQSSMLSSTSPLTPEQRLAEAESQFFSQVAAAQTDPTQIAGLRGLADQVLSEGSSFHGGSTAEFDDLWMRVREAMQGVAGMSIPDAVDPQRAIQQATESTAMSALQQITLASDMIGQMAALSRVTGENPADIADRLGVPIDRLMGIIGDTSGDLVGSLDQQFNELVTGFDMTIDPLLTAQHTQLEATKKMNEDMNIRLDRLENIMARGVVYQQRTANQTAAQNENTRQLIAVERRNAQSGQAARIT